MRVSVCLCLLSVILLPVGVNPAMAGIRVSIQPDTTVTDPFETFTVYTWIDTTGSEFSGYETVIRFDPDAIEFISVAEESLMTDVCNNTWWNTDVGEETIFISHVLLCGGEAITGPGALSSITFQARNFETTTQITFDYIEFYRGGNPVEPVEWHDGVVIIGATSGVAEPEGDTGLRLDIFPNPAGRPVLIRVHLSQPGRTALTVYDCRGRRVAEPIRESYFDTGDHEISWMPREDTDRRAHGVYYCKLRVEDESLTRRVILGF